MKLKKLSLGPLGTNCYIISKDNQALVLDPGGDAPIIIDYLRNNHLELAAILLTHAHFDHIGGVEELRKEFKADVYLHTLEQDWLANAELNRSIVFLGEKGAIKTSQPEKIIDREGSFEVGPFKFKVIHTPGHSPGSVTYYFEEAAMIISGDVLFHNGVGRTDLLGGSIDILADSIINKLYQLPKETKVHPGHGESTTILAEEMNNPYTKQMQ